MNCIVLFGYILYDIALYTLLYTLYNLVYSSV
jgi:hypothetical protein